MSTLSIPCSTSKESSRCINGDEETLGILFYISLVLIVVGISGHRFFKFELERNKKTPENLPSDEKMSPFVFILGAVIATVFSGVIKSWSLRFGIPAIISAIATCLVVANFIVVGPSSPSYSSSEEDNIWIQPIIMIPIFICFTFGGLVKSIGNTYFLEQANNMNPKLGSIKIPLLFLPMLYEIVQLLLILTFKKDFALVNILASMLSSVICCAVAASVERRRLHNVRRLGLLDTPEERIPMSVLWLVPQFVFLAMLDAFLERNMEPQFDTDFFSSSARKYFFRAAHGLSGLGTVGGVLSVYIAGKISKTGGKNWFQYTLNRSHLDRYYWSLTALGAINITFFLIFEVILVCFFLGIAFTRGIVGVLGKASN